ncbi:MAG: LamG-like jellyroll fold domain-containing protein [Pseudomonadota bacterium]
MFRALPLFSAGLLFALPVLAQETQYVPDVLELDGQSTMVFPTDENLDLSGGSTIEFWVQPDWTEAPGFDPVILSYAGEEGASYLITVLRDRDGIGVMSGDTYEVVPFDFSGGQMHHVALISYPQKTDVLVGNDLVAVLPMSIQSLPADGLFIGTSDGENSPFTGALAAVRLWGVPLTQDTVIDWAMRDVLAPQGPEHPDLRFLIGHSDFTTGDFLLASASTPTETGGN